MSEQRDDSIIVPRAEAASFDFDAAFAAGDAPQLEPIRLTLLGQRWELPAAMPAAPTMKVARWMTEGRAEDDLTNAEILALAADMIPGDTLNQWLAKGITMDRLGEVLVWVLGQYMQRTSDTAEPEAEA